MNNNRITCVSFAPSKKKGSDLLVQRAKKEKRVATIRAEAPDISQGWVSLNENVITDDGRSPYIGVDYSQEIFAEQDGVCSYCIKAHTHFGEDILNSAKEYYDNWFALGVVSLELLHNNTEGCFFLSNMIEVPIK